jgi:hypothetical protein
MKDYNTVDGSHKLLENFLNFLLDFSPIWSYVYIDPEGNPFCE